MASIPAHIQILKKYIMTTPNPLLAELAYSMFLPISRNKNKIGCDVDEKNSIFSKNKVYKTKCFLLAKDQLPLYCIKYRCILVNDSSLTILWSE